jgi:hypothetical protein
MNVTRFSSWIAACVLVLIFGGATGHLTQDFISETLLRLIHDLPILLGDSMNTPAA